MVEHTERTSPLLRHAEEARALARSWRGLTLAATGVSLLLAPVVVLFLVRERGMSTWVAIALALLGVATVRGLLDLAFRRLIPWPSLFDLDDRTLTEADIVGRRRAWFWRGKLRIAIWIGIFVGLYFALVGLFGDAVGDTMAAIAPLLPVYFFIGFFLLLVNVFILFGPFLYPAMRQIKAFEPGDADWGVQLADIRGQEMAKEEVRKVVTLWQAGEEFVRAGGKRERGVLFLGPPGTGKTMLAKGIATNFNSPFLATSGAAFSQMFVGVDVLVVMYMLWRAKRLARKWGGQCIVFIDEIDALGTRRTALQPGIQAAAIPSIHDVCFFGTNGAITASGDLTLETERWREMVFASRAPGRSSLYPRPLQGFADWTRNFMFPGGMGNMNSGGLQQLLVAMDGLESPRFLRRMAVNKLNLWMDALYFVPRRIGKLPLRLRPAKPPTDEQVFFIGACNVSIHTLDPALIRPGRMGRHIYFRTPNAGDREDIFDLYLARVAHDDDIDTRKRRRELARITAGYSPAMIEQACSLALTYAHHDGRDRFSRQDMLEAMTTLEAGTATSFRYQDDEARATAIHEAGHAVAGHVFMKNMESTRLTIKPRGETGGHHSMREVEERMFRWRHEQTGELVWTLAAMAAEYVFYGENGNGVGGDLQSATGQAAWMVGRSGMAPPRVELAGPFASPGDEAEAVERIEERFTSIGTGLISRSPVRDDGVNVILMDPAKRELVARLLGQAFVVAYNLIRANRDKVATVADRLVERKEMFGDEVVDLLNSLRIEVPHVDLRSEDAWPAL